MAVKYEGFPAGADTTKVQGAAAQLLVVTQRAQDTLGKVPNAAAETALYTRWFGAVDGVRVKTVQRIVSDIDDMYTAGTRPWSSRGTIPAKPTSAPTTTASLP